MSRRDLLQSAVLLGAGSAWGATNRGRRLMPSIARTPQLVMARTEEDHSAMALRADGAGRWTGGKIAVRIGPVAGEGLVTCPISVEAPGVSLLEVRVRWRERPERNLLLLGDQWERSYGDLGWRGMDPERVLPWYVLATHGASTAGVGVQTGAAAFAYWLVDGSGLELVLDVRNGGRGVLPGNRALLAATLVSEQVEGVSAFQAARQFCGRMCARPKMPALPVYGGNNWYYAYGKSSAGDIRSDSERVASWAPSGENRPWMVIDDGWQPNATAGPWDRGNERFPDMAALAGEMRRIGVRPGIWVRPLFTREEVPEGWKLRSPGAARSGRDDHGATLDPTVPEVVRKVQEDLRRVCGWGYELVKHDFSTFDLLGRWGNGMGANVTDGGWSFARRERTNAEIIADFYGALRAAAGDKMLLGCNTVGHLGAGVFELQRTGDDTSGREWERTRKMGVNTLAFRATQHGKFFAIDADCVGLTRDVPWEENRQWLDLLARSGTPLFVSAAPDAVGPEQKRALEAAFQSAAGAQPLGEPLDWLETTEPQEWKLGGKRVEYDWFLSRQS